MAYSYVRYTGNGSTTNYTFSFPYINSDHIKVRLNGSLSTAFTFPNSSTISLTTPPASGVIIEIRRETPKESVIVNFTDGSVLLERDLDLLATYDLYLAQETKDSLDSGMNQDSLGVWQAQSKRIAAVADPINAQDAVTKAWAETAMSSQLAQASGEAGTAAALAAAAAASAATASTQAGISTTKAGESSTSATASAGSATTATTQAGISTTQAGIATTQASTATTQAGIATTKAAEAAVSAAAALVSETGAAASAVSAANSAAAAATALDNFDDRYLGSKASDPTLDNDGNALLTGALYSNTTTGRMRFYTGSGWVDASSAFVASLINYEYVATAGQTVFSGTDANGISLSYNAGSLIVSLNGLILRDGDDFTATNGTTLTLLSAATAGDELQVHAFGQFQVADVYTKSQSDIRYATAAQGTKADSALQAAAIGVTVQGYDATTLKSAAIGSTVQGFDANTVKKNVANAYTAQQYASEATLTDAATVAWDVSIAQAAKVTLGGNRTFGAPTNQAAGAFYALLVIQDGTGSRTGAWNSVFKFPTATAPTLTTTANAKDFFVFRSDGTNMNLVGKSMDVR